VKVGRKTVNRML